MIKKNRNNKPMKPYYEKKWPVGQCPMCFETLGSHDSCRYCGQPIDYSDLYENKK